MIWKSKGFKGFLILLIMFLFALVYINFNLSKMRYTKIPQDDESLGIKQEEVLPEDPSSQAKLPDDNKDDKKQEEIKKEEVKKDVILDEVEQGDKFKNKIINIALLGGDSRRKNQASHTDAVIVLSIDSVHKKIKMSSIMRDTYLNVHGHGKTKLTHAYSYGGPGLTIRTLNESFTLGIREFVFIDFSGFEKLIDSLDGIEIDIKQYEIKETNKYIKEIASMRKAKCTLLKRPGVQKLNGQQALSYSRIRHVGNGDYERTERQRRVLAAIFQKVKAAGPLKYPSIAASILPYVETNISKTDIVKMGMYILSSDISNIEEKRFPMDGYYKGKTINKVWYIVTDVSLTRKQMHKFIYEK